MRLYVYIDMESTTLFALYEVVKIYDCKPKHAIHIMMQRPSLLDFSEVGLEISPSTSSKVSPESRRASLQPPGS